MEWKCEILNIPGRTDVFTQPTNYINQEKYKEIFTTFRLKRVWKPKLEGIFFIAGLWNMFITDS